MIAPCISAALSDSIAALSHQISQSNAMQYGLWEITGPWIRAKLGPPSFPGYERPYRIFCICGCCYSLGGEEDPNDMYI